MQSSNTPGISSTVAPLPSGCESCCGVTLPWGSSTTDFTGPPTYEAYSAAAAEVSPVEAHTVSTSSQPCLRTSAFR